mgnify:FL=1
MHIGADDLPYPPLHLGTLAPQVIKQPQPLYRDPATTWSNGHELC